MEPGRRSSEEEQLFRKQQAEGSNPPAGSIARVRRLPESTRPGATMSKLRELARSTAQRHAQAIGFGRAAVAPHPQVVVVASVGSVQETEGAAEAGAAAFLYTGAPGGAAAVVSAAGSRPVGCRLEGATGADAASLLEAGVDFLVFSDLLAEASALSAPALGRVPLIDAEWDEATVWTLAALAALELDAALMEPPPATTGTGRLSARSLATMRHRSALLRAPLAIDARDLEGELEPETITGWRDAGAPILVVAAPRTAEAVAAVAAVPPPTERALERASPMLPAGFSMAAASNEDDYDD